MYKLSKPVYIHINSVVIRINSIAFEFIPIVINLYKMDTKRKSILKIVLYACVGIVTCSITLAYH